MGEFTVGGGGGAFGDGSVLLDERDFVGGAGEDGKVIGSGILFRVVEANGIDEVGVKHPEREGFPVHFFGKLFRCFAVKVSQGECCVVGRFDHDAFNQLVDGNFFIS